MANNITSPHHPYHYQYVGPASVFPQSPSKPTIRPTPRPPRPPVHPALPNDNNGNGRGEGGGGGLGLPAITFISIGSTVVLIVFLVCVIIACRHSRRAKMTTKNESKVGRAIQRKSFFPRFSRYRNQPIVVSYPDPDSHLPNYPIRTPYTFSSSSTLASIPGGSINSAPNQPIRDKDSMTEAPTYRATIY